MPSAIDPTKPQQGNPTTASVRANFAAAKTEIDALQIAALAAASASKTIVFQKLIFPVGPIANTETQVIGASIPANTIQYGDVLTIEMHGTKTNTTTAATATVRLRCGPNSLSGAILATSTFAQGTAAKTNVVLMVNATANLQTPSGYGNGQAQIRQDHGYASATTPTAAAAYGSIDTTVDVILEMTYQSGNAAANATFTSGTLRIER